jgi:polyhydroxybutyrate depolymerase
VVIGRWYASEVSAELRIEALLLASALAAFGCADDGAHEALSDLDASAGEGEAGAPVRDASVLSGAAGGRDASAQDAAPGARDGSLQDAAPDARDASVLTDGPIDDAAGTGDDRRSAGCGKAKTGTGDFERRSVRAGNRDRTYHVRVPTSYQASRAYPLIFRWHGSGGDGLSGGLGIEYAAGDDAIVVGADGLNERWDAASEADDLALFDVMYQQLAQEYCIDLKRVFSYGFSAGGGMTNMLSCKRGDKLRASAAIAGYVWGAQSSCGPAVAAWFLHDRDDEAVTIEMGREGRARALDRNECGSTTLPAANGCVSYDGCKPGYPVIWCETQGVGHNIAGETAPAQVWAFFDALP